jgi:hypothetical protein
MIWTEEQVENLKKRQRNFSFHPYTCGCHSEDLIPTINGWVCPITEEVVQEWAYSDDLNGENNYPSDEFNKILFELNRRD